jgi:hypothetical protein
MASFPYGAKISCGIHHDPFLKKRGICSVLHTVQIPTQKERRSTNKKKAVSLAGGTGGNAYFALTARTVH